jgi:hypothetical protein
MDYYLCNKDSAPQLAATQADAKALDRAFTPYAIDTAKKPLMEFINSLLNGTSELMPPSLIKVSPSSIDFDEIEQSVGEARPKVVHIPSTNCPACHREPVVAKGAARSDALDDVLTFIEGVRAQDEAYILERIEEMVAIARKYMAPSEEAAPTPPKRKRNHQNTKGEARE